MNLIIHLYLARDQSNRYATYALHINVFNDYIFQECVVVVVIFIAVVKEENTTIDQIKNKENRERKK